MAANPFPASGTGAAGIKPHFSGTNERVAEQEQLCAHRKSGFFSYRLSSFSSQSAGEAQSCHPLPLTTHFKGNPAGKIATESCQEFVCSQD